MQLSKLITLSYTCNVGTSDRVLRIIVGIALAVIPWFVNPATTSNIVLTVVGGMVAVSGLVARCSVYYLLGHSTRTNGR